MGKTEERVIDWDDQITDDGEYSGEESVVLPEGNYPFEVIKVEKAWYDGSDKLPACNMAKVFLRIEDTDKKREVEGGVQQIVQGLALGQTVLEFRGFGFQRFLGKGAVFRLQSQDLIHQRLDLLDLLLGVCSKNLS